jgi:6-phosphofructokinase
LAVINVGSPACGVNAAVRSIIRYGLCEGHKMFAVFDGFEGLINNQVRKISLQKILMMSILGEKFELDVSEWLE